MRIKKVHCASNFAYYESSLGDKEDVTGHVKATATPITYANHL